VLVVVPEFGAVFTQMSQELKHGARYYLFNNVMWNPALNNTQQNTEVITALVLRSTMPLNTLHSKKSDISYMTITLVNLNRFLQFLYHFNHEEILRATVVKFIESSYFVN